MRSCPSLEGSAPPLITHRIGVEVCMARQRTFFHKCHRCVFRGKAATWEPEVPPLPMIQVAATEVPTKVDVPGLVLPRGKAKSVNGKPKPVAEKPIAKPVEKPKAAAGARKAAKAAEVG